MHPYSWITTQLTHINLVPLWTIFILVYLFQYSSYMNSDNRIGILVKNYVRNNVQTNFIPYGYEMSWYSEMSQYKHGLTLKTQKTDSKFWSYVKADTGFGFLVKFHVRIRCGIFFGSHLHIGSKFQCFASLRKYHFQCGWLSCFGFLCWSKDYRQVR